MQAIIPMPTAPTVRNPTDWHRCNLCGALSPAVRTYYVETPRTDTANLELCPRCVTNIEEDAQCYVEAVQ